MFITERRLEEHEIKGQHTFPVKKDTMRDYAIKMFGMSIETKEAAKLAVQQDSLVLSSGNSQPVPVEGWSLKKVVRTAISPASRTFAINFFNKNRSLDPPRRACPRVCSQEMQEHKTGNDYTFKLSEVYSEKQLMSLFSRMEKKRLQEEENMKTKGAAGTKANKATRKGGKRGARKVEENEEEEEESDEDFVLEEDEGDFIRGCVNERRNSFSIEIGSLQTLFRRFIYEFVVEV
ncbi:hypothetical protein PFISCL1PPCAC_19960 [Pristionchus fissidentatus]|uniref:Uncharacterized protein n=1 Tax=Pristionchus fissidentatus TaxID=1538716 RepID=A0AAV5WE81_9BILA|nr:hypothetical protein PFISCL1PPCAC_19960 [Pristionchus fissidentatus]